MIGPTFDELKAKFVGLRFDDYGSYATVHNANGYIGRVGPLAPFAGPAWAEGRDEKDAGMNFATTAAAVDWVAGTSQVNAPVAQTAPNDGPSLADRVAQLEAENAALRVRNVALELLLVSSVGVILAPAPNREVAALHVEDIRKALSARNGVGA